MKRISVPQAIAILVVLIFTLYLAMIAECSADDFFQTDQKIAVGAPMLGAPDKTPEPEPGPRATPTRKQKLEFLSPDGVVIESLEFDGARYSVAWDEPSHGWKLRDGKGNTHSAIAGWGTPNWRVRDRSALGMVKPGKETPTPKIPTVKTAQGKPKALGIMDINGPDFRSPQTTPRRALTGRKP